MSPTQTPSFLFSLALLFSSIAASANPASQIVFVNSCNGVPTAVVSSDGVEVHVTVTGLGVHEKIEASLSIHPDENGNIVNDLPQSDPSLIKKKLTASSQGIATFVSSVEFPHGDSLDSRVWDAELNWSSLTSPGLGGTARTKLYLMKQDSQRFYSLVSASSCQWQTEIVPISQYAFNNLPSTSTFDQDLQLDMINPLKGLDFEVKLSDAPTVEQGPLIQGPQPYFGWYFSGWNNAFGVHGTRTYRRTWPLAQNTGGFLTQSTHYNRFDVEEYALKKKNGCHVWSADRVGSLDVGRTVLDFLIVPEGISKDSAAVTQFINDTYTTTDTCGALLPKADANSRVLNSDNTAPLYFYPR